MLNAGHRRGAVAGRCVVKGKTIETEELPAYCAVAARRARRTPRHPAVPLRHRADAAPRAGRAGRAVPASRPRTRRARPPRRTRRVGRRRRRQSRRAVPDMPDGIDDRDADVWEALLAVADAAGGDWPERARVAAVTLVTDSKAATPSLGVRLLSDLRDVFGDADAMFTDAHPRRPHALDEAPWGDLRGKPLNARGLAQRLGKYGVKRDHRPSRRPDRQGLPTRRPPRPVDQVPLTPRTPSPCSGDIGNNAGRHRGCSEWPTRQFLGGVPTRAPRLAEIPPPTNVDPPSLTRERRESRGALPGLGSQKNRSRPNPKENDDDD